MADKTYCYYPFQHMHVHSNGNVFMCCYQRLVSIGNVLTHSFKDVWFGEVANSIREETLKGQLHRACNTGGCPYLVQPRFVGTASPVGMPNALFIHLPNYHCNIGGPNPSEKRPACLMCERAAPGYVFDKVNHLDDILPRLSPMLPALKQIHIQGVAEAFYRDEIFYSLDRLGFPRHRDEIRATTVTNGTLLNPKKLTQFLEYAPLSALTWSIDAATPETYKKIRRLDAFDLVYRNIISYSQLRKKFGNSEFKIQHNINTLNVDEVVDMVRFAREVGAEVLEFGVTYSTGWIDEILVNESNWRRFADAEQAIRKEAERLGQYVEFLTPLSLEFGKQSQVAAALA